MNKKAPSTKSSSSFEHLRIINQNQQEYSSYPTPRTSTSMLKVILPLTFLLIGSSIIQSSHSFQPSSSSSPSHQHHPTTTTTTALKMKTIDSHLHVWASSAESTTYPYAPNQTPPPPLLDTSSTASLLQQMAEAKVDGALIVQPINHQYDHRYVRDAIRNHPDKFKGMMLFDPALDGDDALVRFEELVLEGFVGVRFNPYLFEGKMSENEGAVKVFQRCAELKIPVGIMCFKGIELHYDDIQSLCQLSPETIVVLDHFGFASVENQKQFENVLTLKERNVVVKISALFRLGEDFPYERVKKERFDPLLKAYGADRLMFGTDFPFVTQEEIGYKGAVDVLSSWLSARSEEEKNLVMGGTAERLFGFWGKQ